MRACTPPPLNDESYNDHTPERRRTDFYYSSLYTDKPGYPLHLMSFGLVGKCLPADGGFCVGYQSPICFVTIHNAADNDHYVPPLCTLVLLPLEYGLSLVANDEA